MTNVLRFTVIVLLLWHIPGNAIPSSDKTIQQLLNQANQLAFFQDKIAFISDSFIGKPYRMNCLGEGATGQYDKDPLFRFDKFDCQTYIETVLALALARNTDQFKKIITRVRYTRGIAKFCYRNHFITSDWIPANERNGYIRDITSRVADGNVIYDQTFLDKKRWLQHLSLQYIHLPQASEQAKQRALAHLKSSTKLANQQRYYHYIPLNYLLSDSEQQHYYPATANIPTGAIILVVSPHWRPLHLGTALNVSHMGFAIWKHGNLYFRHASKYRGTVVDDLFIPYFQRYLPAEEHHIKGISVFLPTDPYTEARSMTDIPDSIDDLAHASTNALPQDNLLSYNQ